MNLNLRIIFIQNSILVYLHDELFLKQYIIKNTKNYGKNLDYTFFFVIIVLYKFGLIDIY